MSWTALTTYGINVPILWKRGETGALLSFKKVFVLSGYGARLLQLKMQEDHFSKKVTGFDCKGFVREVFRKVL